MVRAIRSSPWGAGKTPKTADQGLVLSCGGFAYCALRVACVRYVVLNAGLFVCNAVCVLRVACCVLHAVCCVLGAMHGHGYAFARCSGNEWVADAVGPRGQRGKLDLGTKGKRDPVRRKRDYGNKVG